MARTRRGSADYEHLGQGYRDQRQEDPRIAQPILASLGPAETIANVGAGAGSYEPRDRRVIAIEPSPTMRAQRPADRAPAIHGHAEALPLGDDSVDAALAVLTLHHWNDPEAGLREMRRVARGPVVVLTFDPEVKVRHWLWADYLREAVDVDRVLFPKPDVILDALGGGTTAVVPIPRDCRDGFTEAYYARPEGYLDPRVRNAQSLWSRLGDRVVTRALGALDDDLRSGRWDSRHGHLRRQATCDWGLRLIASPGCAPRESADARQSANGRPDAPHR
jgi:SAM-dependent methyltransferase